MSTSLLWDYLGQIPDSRKASGRQYSLQSILSLLVAGMICGKQSLRAIARWGRRLSPEQLQIIGIERGSSAKDLLFHIPIDGNIISGDAIFCQKEICKDIIENMVTMYLRSKEIRLHFLKEFKRFFPQKGDYFEISAEKTVKKSHGRLEKRELKATTTHNGFPGWSSVQQIFHVHRERTIGLKHSTEDVYGITSLSPAQADASRLLGINRSHWGIENKLHHVRYTIFNEDRSRVRIKTKAQALAALRNAAITVIQRTGFSNIVEAIEVYAENRRAELSLVRFGRTK